MTEEQTDAEVDRLIAEMDAALLRVLLRAARKYTNKRKKQRRQLTGRRR